MVEQKAKFVAAGISTKSVGEAQKNPAAWKKVINGQIQLVYINPENIICNCQYRQMLRSSIYKENLMEVAVDEAHCIKTWFEMSAYPVRFCDSRRDEFRKAYACLGQLRSIVSPDVFLWLSLPWPLKGHLRSSRSGYH